MRTNLVVASAACVAAMAGWWARGIEWAPIDSASSPAPLQRASIASRNDAVAFAVTPHRTQSREVHSTRNLFAYRTAPTLVQHVVHVAPPPVEVVRAVAPPPVIESRPRLQFHARYIGRFGPERSPIAAFSRDGQVTTVRVGEHVDEHFVLRRIGLESVEVQARDGEELVTQQVPLG